MSGNTVRFVGEFDDTKITQGLNNVKTSLSSLSSMQVPSLFAGMEAEMAHLEQTTNALEQSTNSLEQGFTGLDSASTGISGSFEEIGNAANQAGQNFDTLGTSGQTAQQQLAEIGTTSTTAGQSMTALGGSATTAETNFGALNTTLGTAQGGLTEFNTLSGTTTSTMGDMGDSAETTGSKFESVFGKGGNIAVGISATISGIANLVRGFRDYGDSQIRVEKATIAVSKAQEAVQKAQEKYNAAVAEGGKNSADAQKALVDLGQAQDTLGVRQENLTIQTKRSADAQVNMWLGLAGTVTGIGGSIIQSLDAIGGEKGLTGLASKAKAASFNLGGLSVSMLGLGSALAIVTTGVILADRLLQDDAKTMAAFATEGIKLTKVQEDGNKAFAEMNRIMAVTHMSMLQIVEDPVKAAAAYKAMGGEVDANGKIVSNTADQWDAARSPLQILWDTMFGGAKATNDAASALKTMDTTVNTHIPTVIKLTSSVRSLGYDTRESYTIGAKALDMYNVEQQKNTTVINAAYEEFKKLHGGVTTTTTVIESANSAVAQSSDVYSQWINKGVDPANQIINELSTSVRNGVIPQDQLGKAVELAADKLQAAGVVTEANKDQTILLATAHLKTVPAVDAAAKALEKYKAEQADAKRINDEYTKALEDSTQKMVDLTEEGHQYDDMLAILNSVTGQHIMLNDKNIESMQGLANALKASRTEYKKQEEAMGVVLDKHGLLTTAIEQKIMDEKDDRNELNQLVIAQVDWTDALDGSVGGLDLVASGTAKAVIEMDDFVKSAVEGEAKTKALNEMYAELGRTMVGDLHTTIPLTTKDLTELGKTFKDGVPLAEKLAKIVEEDLTSAFETFSEVIEAATKKDFKEAWKGLELGDVGKRFKGELKEILKGMNEIAKSGKEVATVVSGLVVGALQGMSDKGLSQGIDAIVEGFNKFKSLDPDATIVQPLINFVNSLPAENKAAGLLAVHQGLEDVSTAQAKGNITTEEAKRIMGEYTPMIEAYNKAIAEGKSPTDALAIATGQIGAAADKTAGQYDPLQTNILKTATAYDTLVNGIANATVTFPVPDISPFTTAILTISTGWDTLVAGIQGAKIIFPAPSTTAFINAVDTVVKRWQSAVKTIGGMKPALSANNTSAIQIMDAVVKRWQSAKSTIESIKPKITVDNSQALKAINAVVSAMSKVKSKSVTITTTYKTVGSPAGHGTAASTAKAAGGHGVMPTGAENIAIPPMINNAVLTAPTVGGGGDLNITIVNRDEFGTEKVRKYKAALGGSRFTFGTVGAGG